MQDSVRSNRSTLTLARLVTVIVVGLLTNQMSAAKGGKGGGGSVNEHKVSIIFADELDDLVQSDWRTQSATPGANEYCSDCSDSASAVITDKGWLDLYTRDEKTNDFRRLYVDMGQCVGVAAACIDQGKVFEKPASLRIGVGDDTYLNFHSLMPAMGAQPLQAFLAVRKDLDDIANPDFNLKKSNLGIVDFFIQFRPDRWPGSTPITVQAFDTDSGGPLKVTPDNDADAWVVMAEGTDVGRITKVANTVLIDADDSETSPPILYQFPFTAVVNLIP